MNEPPLTAVYAHARQFVIGRCVHRIDADWGALDLVDGYVLSYSPGLRIRVRVRPDGGQHVLLGHAYEAVPERAPVDEFLAATVGGDPVHETYGWAGRWVAISDGFVVGDFSNSLGLFYWKEHGEFLVSSSLAILYRLIPGRRLIWRRFNRCGMNWTPPPVTRMEGVRKLLPDQAIDLPGGSIRPVRKSRLVPGRLLDAEAVGALLLAALQHIWKQLGEGFQRIRLPLTAGRDSRTLMAAGLSAGIGFDAVTLEYERMSLADRRMPAQICASSDVAHRFVPLGRPRPALEGLYDQHTLGDTEEADRDFWRRNMFSWLEDGDCLVRGAAFGLGRLHFHPVFRGLTWEAVARDPRLLVRRFGDFASVRLEAAQISEWVAWRSQHPGPLGWVETFHLDQRLCGWAAAAEQGLDLLRGISINPANCGYILDALQNTDMAARSAGTHQLECIRQSGTGLDRFLFNPTLEGPLLRSAARVRQIIARGTTEGANLLGI